MQARKRILLTALAAGLLWSLGGCGGYYVVAVPDQVAPAGGEAVVVSRLQRNDFFFLALAVPEAAMRYTLAGEERAAYTDKIGYAGTTVAAPAVPGVYPLRVSHLDFEGEEIAETVPLYVFDPDRPVAAVALDDLPRRGSAEAAEAAEALQRLARRADLLYLTRRDVGGHAGIHSRLRLGGYPDGPVLLWQRQRWHIVRGKWNVPQVVVESRLVSQLPDLRTQFPKLESGVCRSVLAAKAFAEAGLRCVVVGDAKVPGPRVTRVDSWAALGQMSP